MNTMTDVLRPNIVIEPHFYRNVPSGEPRSEQQQNLLTEAAQRVRKIYLEGLRPSSSLATKEQYFDACFDTHMTIFELDKAVARDDELSVAKAIFERAGFNSEKLRPTTLAAQIDMQIFCVEFAKRFCMLFANQQAMI